MGCNACQHAAQHNTEGGNTYHTILTNDDTFDLWDGLLLEIEKKIIIIRMITGGGAETSWGKMSDSITALFFS